MVLQQQQQQQVIVGLDLGGRKQNLHFNVHMLSPPSNSPYVEPPKGIICASGKNNPCRAAVPAVAVCSGSTDVHADAVAPARKDCEGEPSSRGVTRAKSLECRFPE